MPGHGWRHTTRTNTSPSTSQCFHFGLVCPARSSRWSPSPRHMACSSAVTTIRCGISIFFLVLVSGKRMGGYSHNAQCKSTAIPAAFVSALYVYLYLLDPLHHPARLFPLSVCFLFFLIFRRLPEDQLLSRSH